jgi:hypothetical protein
VYILKTLRTDSPTEKKKPTYEYRVQVIHAIGNVLKDFRVLFEAFENSAVYDSHKLAEDAAIELDQQLFTEHDVLLMPQFSHHTWDEIKKLATTELEKVA